MKNLYPLYWALLAAAILLLDYATGFFIILTALLIFPVALASWFNGRGWGLAVAVTAPLVGLGFHSIRASPATFTEAAITAAVGVATFSLFAILIDLVSRQSAEIRVLKGILPTCAWCKKIRDESNGWQQMETYISERSEASFSHGICPECAKANFGKVLTRTGTGKARSDGAATKTS